MDNKSPPLCTAAFNGDYKECERLIQEGADINEADAEGESPLKLAVWEGHLDVIQPDIHSLLVLQNKTRTA